MSKAFIKLTNFTVTDKESNEPVYIRRKYIACIKPSITGGSTVHTSFDRGFSVKEPPEDILKLMGEEE